VFPPETSALIRGRVEFAITGSCTRKDKPELTEKCCAEIRKVLFVLKWKDLRAELEEKHGIKVQYKVVAGSGGSPKKTDS
jgi:hypothetical protein